MFLTRQIIRGLLPFIPKKDPRKVLKGALFGRTEDGEPYAIATDGRIGVKFQWQEKFPSDDFPTPLDEIESARQPGEVIIRTDDLHALDKAVPKVKSMPILNGVALGEVIRDNYTVPAVATDLSTISRMDLTPTPGTYPFFDKVVPKPVLDGDNPSYIVVGIGIERMIQALQGMLAAGAHSDSRHKAVSLYVPKDPLAPILLRGYGWDSGLDAQVVVMPVAEVENLLNRRGFDPLPADAPADAPEE